MPSLNDAASVKSPFQWPDVAVPPFLSIGLAPALIAFRSPIPFRIVCEVHVESVHHDLVASNVQNRRGFVYGQNLISPFVRSAKHPLGVLEYGVISWPVRIHVGPYADEGSAPRQ